MTCHEALITLRAMDPWRKWTVSESVECEADSFREESEPSAACKIECDPGYTGSIRGFNGRTLEECLMRAQNAFSKDIDAQVAVMAGCAEPFSPDNVDELKALNSRLRIGDEFGKIRQRISEHYDDLTSQRSDWSELPAGGFRFND